MKKVLGLIAGSMLLAAPALAAEAVYNCDYAPSCEVAPGIYGKMSNPVTSKFNLSIGGYVKLDYAYNSVDLGPAGMITPGSGKFPIAGTNAAKQQQSIMSVDQSRLWFKVAGPTFLGAKTNALIEGDFYNNALITDALQESPGFRIRLAYGTLDWANTQILFGQFWDVFGPMVSSTQDFRSGATTGAPNTPRTPQLRLTQKINFNENNQLKLVVAAVDPQQAGNNVGVGTVTPDSYSSMPNFAGQMMFVSKALGTSPGYFGMSMQPLTVGVFGQYGITKDNVANAGKAVPTWGGGVYAFVPVLKSKDGKSRAMTMSLEGQAYEAANMSYNAATATDINQTAPTTPAANVSAAKGIGYTGQLMFYPTQDLGIVAGYGKRQALNNADYTATGYLQSLRQIYANVTYDLNAAVRVAAEYQNFTAQYSNQGAVHGREAVGTDNTVRLCAYYFF